MQYDADMILCKVNFEIEYIFLGESSHAANTRNMVVADRKNVSGKSLEKCQ